MITLDLIAWLLIGSYVFFSLLEVISNAAMDKVETYLQYKHSVFFNKKMFGTPHWWYKHNPGRPDTILQLQDGWHFSKTVMIISIEAQKYLVLIFTSFLVLLKPIPWSLIAIAAFILVWSLLLRFIIFNLFYHKVFHVEKIQNP